MSAPKKKRADELVVQSALLETRSKAQAFIMAGQIEYLKNDQWIKVEKAGQSLAIDTQFRLLDVHGADVGRGAKKLRGALEHFGLKASGVGLDVGSSTGGFTQVLLESGCEQVLAMDVGTHQLHEKLRRDSRVLSVENQHVLRMDQERWKDLRLQPPFDCIVCDLSFISLTKVISTIWPWLKSGGWWVMLVKPQFELEPKKVPGGLVKSEPHRLEAMEKVLTCLRQQENLIYKDQMESPIQGSEGNREYLVWVEKDKL